MTLNYDGTPRASVPARALATGLARGASDLLMLTRLSACAHTSHIPGAISVGVCSCACRLYPPSLPLRPLCDVSIFPAPHPSRLSQPDCSPYGVFVAHPS